jgi:hypothetical protein
MANVLIQCQECKLETMVGWTPADRHGPGEWTEELECAYCGHALDPADETDEISDEELRYQNDPRV